jgi:hypothetical protein
MSNKYDFKLPVKLNFKEVANEFVNEYDEVSQEVRMHTLQVYAQYTCFGTPYFVPAYCEGTESS